MFTLNRVFSVCVVLVSCIGSSGVAASDLKWSAGVGGIYSFGHDIDYSDVDGDSGVDRVEAGFGVSLLAARQLGAFSVGAELFYLKNDAKEYQTAGDAQPVPTTGEFSHTALVVNGLYHAKRTETWDVYLGAGVGVSQFAADGLSDADTLFLVDGNDTVAVAQAKVGGIYWPGVRVGVQFGYRLFWSAEAELPAISLPDGEKWTNISGPVVAHCLELGVRLRW